MPKTYSKTRIRRQCTPQKTNSFYCPGCEFRYITKDVIEKRKQLCTTCKWFENNKEELSAVSDVSEVQEENLATHFIVSSMPHLRFSRKCMSPVVALPRIKLEVVDSDDSPTVQLLICDSCKFASVRKCFYRSCHHSVCELCFKMAKIHSVDGCPVCSEDSD